jgi:hypothetical protein
MASTEIKENWKEISKRAAGVTTKIKKAATKRAS